MKLTLLGTGTPTPSLKRASSGYLIEVGDDVIVMDHGPGAHERLLRAGKRATDVTHIFFSHLHYDHCCDFARLLLTRWDMGAGKIPELKVFGPPHGKGSISIIDFTTRQIVQTWPMPGGGSPDMGNVSVDGKTLWLSGRFDNVVYGIDPATGKVKSIPVPKEPHGLAVWPQPGRYSLGHTGNLR